MNDNINIKDYTIEHATNEILDAIQLYIDNGNIDDMRTQPGSRWNACLIFVCNQVFKPCREKLLIKDDMQSSTINSSNMPYDIDLIYNICELYIALCYEYDKDITVMSFSYLTGINHDTIYRWNNEHNKYIYTNSDGEKVEKRFSCKPSDIYKKLHASRENVLNDMLTSKGRNPVGVLGLLNHFYGYNTQGQQQQAPVELKITLENAPMLQDNLQNTPKLTNKLAKTDN